MYIVVFKKLKNQNYHVDICTFQANQNDHMLDVTSDGLGQIITLACVIAFELHSNPCDLSCQPQHTTGYL